MGLIYESPLWETKYPFYKSDLTWMTQIADGDNAIFYSPERERYDTLLYYDVKIKGPTNAFPFHWKDPGSNWFELGIRPYPSVFHAYINFPDSSYTHYCDSFWLRRLNADGPMYISAKIGKYSYKSVCADSILTSIKFYNEIVPALIINKDSSEILHHWKRYPQIISEVIWSKPYGIIEYTLTTGEKYHLVEYLHADGRVEKFGDGD